MWLCWIALGLGWAILAGAVAKPALCQCVPGDERPNILFFMSDDHAAQVLGAYDGRLSVLDPTPTLDRLAGEGMQFRRANVSNINY
jgi:hypothetical protein